MSGHPPRGGGGGVGRGRGNLPFAPRGGGGRGRGDLPFHPRGGDRGGRGGGRGRGGGPREVEIYGEGAAPRPDATVARVEGETEAAWKLAAAKGPAPASGASNDMPQRPGFGTMGRAIVLWTNFFNLEVNSQAGLVFYRYSLAVSGVDGAKTPTGKRLKRLVQVLLEDHFASYGYSIVTDFAANLFSRIEMEKDKTYTVVYRSEGEEEASPDAKQYEIRVRSSGSLTVSDLLDHISSPQANRSLQSKEEILQALNLVAGQYPKSDASVANVGANRHFPLSPAPGDKVDLGGGLSAIRGFFMSVRSGTARLLLNIQVKHAAFFNNGPLETLIQSYATQNGYNKVRLANFLKRLSVDVLHIEKRNKAGKRIPRFKTITGLATRDDGRNQEHPPIVADFGAGSMDVKFYLNEPAPREQTDGSAGKKKKNGRGTEPKPPALASSASGKYISVYDYFTQNYPRFKIREPRLPVVNVGTKDQPSYLPPEVCLVVPGQPSNSKLSAEQTQQMIRFAVRMPNQNAQTIVSAGTRLLGFEPTNSTLASWGVNVVPGLLTVPGRVLTAPDVKYYNNKSASTRFGSWNMANIQLSSCAPLNNWTYLMIAAQGQPGPWNDEASLRATIADFTDGLKAVGIRAPNCSPGMRIVVDPSAPEAEISNAFERFKRTPGRAPPKMILVIMPFVSTAIYRSVKYACDVREGLVNVCVIASKLVRANLQYHSNVALKINLKLGGRNQELDKDKLGIIAEGKTMVMGMDVTHPAPGSSQNAPSVASIVASVDPWLAQWPADLRIQTGTQEKITDLAALCKSRLLLWRAKQGQFPENILVYRDGVSEGQYPMVVEQELPELRNACKAVYPPDWTKRKLPRLTVVVVGKRHHTAFYPTRKEDADRSSNAPNGTIVDRAVTEARNWDFFLQAHTALQGTARPAHYFVVHDEIFRARKTPPPFRNTADVLESLTHNLCYLFGRATKAVSVCPPAYYADLACERSRHYLGGLIDASPMGSQAGSVRSGRGAEASMVKIHDDVKDTMFYI